MSDNLKYGVAIVIVGLAVIFTLGGNLFEGKEREVQEAVAAQLRDPSSAEFRDLTIGENSSCGEVNGKNGFGAYSGFREFVYARGVVLFEPEQPSGFNVARQTAFYEAQAKFFRFKRNCISQ